MDHLPGSDVVQYYRRRFHIRDFVGDRQEVLRLTHEQLAVATVHGKRRNPLTDFEASDTRADGIDNARDLVAGYERYLWRIEVLAGQHDQVG